MPLQTKRQLAPGDSHFRRATTLAALHLYPSVSAVLQRGLEMLREETEQKDLDRAAMRQLLDERRRGEFISLEDSEREIEEIISNEKLDRGL